MDNKESNNSNGTKETILIAIQGITLLLFLAWAEITCGGLVSVLVEYIVFGVIGVVFLVSHILYIIPIRKAKKAAKQAFYNSIKEREKNIFDDYDDNVFEQYDVDAFEKGNDKEEK